MMMPVRLLSASLSFASTFRSQLAVSGCLVVIVSLLVLGRCIAACHRHPRSYRSRGFVVVVVVVAVVQNSCCSGS